MAFFKTKQEKFDELTKSINTIKTEEKKLKKKLKLLDRQVKLLERDSLKQENTLNKTAYSKAVKRYNLVHTELITLTLELNKLIEKRKKYRS